MNEYDAPDREAHAVPRCNLFEGIFHWEINDLSDKHGIHLPIVSTVVEFWPLNLRPC